MAGGAGVGKPIVVSGFAGLSSTGGGSAVDDDEDSPPSSSFNLPLRRASQQPASTAAGSQAGIKLPAQVQQMVKPPTNIGNGSSNAAKGPVAGEGRGHGVLRRLSMGANSLLSRVRSLVTTRSHTFPSSSHFPSLFLLLRLVVASLTVLVCFVLPCCALSFCSPILPPLRPALSLLPQSPVPPCQPLSGWESDRDFLLRLVDRGV